MGDSDDDFDSRRNHRDKFRRERDDFGGNRGSHNRSNGGEWNDGRDRPNQYRRQYSGGGGPPPGRDFPPRYNRSPGRYDMSPPHNKRVRRDWDGPDQPPSRFDSPGNPNYFHGGGGGFHSGFPSNVHQSQDPFNKDTSDGTTQPPMFSFKHFLREQDDNIDQEEAVKRYNDYKIDFKKTQIAEFFNAHKDEDWFKHKYHPDEYSKRREEQRDIVKKRLEIFMELYQKGYLDDVSVDIESHRTLTRFLDAVVIKSEGGNDQDLRILDTVTSSSNITLENDDGDEDTSKPSLNTNEPEKTASKTSINSTNRKNSTETKRKREGSVSDDGAVSDGDDDKDEDDEMKKTNGKNDISEEGDKKKENGSTNSESKENVERKTSSEDIEREAGEVPDAPRALHRTLSIFFRHLPIQTTKEDLENLCKTYSGFRRACISDPAPERKFSRRGWVTFDHSVQIRNICYELNSTKLHDVDVAASINRDLKNRIRTINGIGQHKTIVRNDLRLISKIIQQLDDRWNLWHSSNDEKKPEATATATATTTTDDSEISSSTAAMIISPMKNKKPIGFVSQNPLLKNITEYLVEEADAEEEELLGDSTNQQNETNTFEMDKELTKVLDRLILYLRVVYSIDYYNGSEYTQEDAMPNRCGVIHVRGPPLSSITESELTNFMLQFESRIKPLIDCREKIDDDEAVKLGLKNEEDEVEKFMKANCQEVGKDKWSCPLSGKKFKGPEFVRKHILNKHQDKIDEAKKDVVYFNNYLYDPKRSQLLEHPSTRSGAGPTGSHPSGLPLPTPGMGGQGLINRPPIWPSMSGPNPYYNQFHHQRHPRPPLMYPNPGGPIHRPPMNRQMKSYEDLDAPNEMLF